MHLYRLGELNLVLLNRYFALSVFLLTRVYYSKVSIKQYTRYIYITKVVICTSIWDLKLACINTVYSSMFQYGNILIILYLILISLIGQYCVNLKKYCIYRHTSLNRCRRELHRVVRLST